LLALAGTQRRERRAHQAPAYNDSGTGAARPGPHRTPAPNATPRKRQLKVLAFRSKKHARHKEHSPTLDVEDALNQRGIFPLRR
jgi:hypothetical protein